MSQKTENKNTEEIESENDQHFKIEVIGKEVLIIGKASPIFIIDSFVQIIKQDEDMKTYISAALQITKLNSKN